MSASHVCTLLSAGRGDDVIPLPQDEKGGGTALTPASASTTTTTSTPSRRSRCPPLPSHRPFPCPRRPTSLLRRQWRCDCGSTRCSHAAKYTRQWAVSVSPKLPETFQRPHQSALDLNAYPRCCASRRVYIRARYYSYAPYNQAKRAVNQRWEHWFPRHCALTVCAFVVRFFRTCPRSAEFVGTSTVMPMCPCGLLRSSAGRLPSYPAADAPSAANPCILAFQPHRRCRSPARV